MDFAPGLLDLVARARVRELFDERHGSRAPSPWRGWAIVATIVAFAGHRRPGAHPPAATRPGRANA